MTQEKQRVTARIGVLGGRFDPVHIGHIAIAKAAREQYALDTVLLLVAKDPPHKQSHASAEARYEMALLAAEEAGLQCSRMELDREGMTYTVDSLRQMRAMHGDSAQIFYIIGADTLLQLLDWKHAQEVMRLCDFIVFYRPGEDVEAVLNQARLLNARFGEPMLLARVPGPDISSTAIRERLRAGLSVEGYVSPAVARYISSHGLYRDGPEQDALLASFDLEHAKAVLRERISPKRMAHSLGVMETAARLARRFGADERRAVIAGLLHDIAKDMTHEELLSAIREHCPGIEADMLAYPSLLHAPLGAALVKKEFGITDVEVCSAIALHTTGKPDMTLLEKIIYLADAIEPGRKDVDDIRALAETDLDAALLLAIDDSMDYALQKGGAIHPLSQQARQYLFETVGQRQ